MATQVWECWIPIASHVGECWIPIASQGGGVLASQVWEFWIPMAMAPWMWKYDVPSVKEF